MSLTKFDRSFAPTNRQLNYLSKTFPQWRENLISFARAYFPDTYSDFNEASPGMMFIEMASYVGDVLGYYIDAQFKENLIEYAQEQDNIISIAQSLGYKPHPASPATTFAEFYQLCPAGGASVNYSPDERYLLRLQANTVVTSADFGNVTFRTTDEVNFADPQERTITVYALDGAGKPSTYLVKKKAKVIAGTIKTYNVSFGDAQRFSKVAIPDSNVLEIISVVDSSGFVWNEVDYLAQDLVFDARENTRPTTINGQSVPPNFLVRLKRQPRRFVTRYDSNFTMELHFGSGILDDTDATINLEPSKIANDEYQHNLASTSIDPSDFLSSRAYGLSPSNISLTITYAVGGGVESNVPSNTINSISTTSVLNDRNGFSLAERALFDDVVSSLAVNNPEPATGGKDTETVEEIRQNALAFFNAQNRLVNAQDYAVRVYAMPPKFGSVAKSFVLQDEQINNILRTTNQQASIDSTLVSNPVNPNAINLYVLGYNRMGKLSILNDDVKRNLATYLDQYRLLTDEIRIMDAFVVNIGVDFKIAVFRNFNMNEVLARAIDAVRNFFGISKWQINQPIVLSDLTLEIAKVEGVQSVIDVRITNKYGFKNGSDYANAYYDLSAATINGVIYPSLDPCIFELRYPDDDIVGNAVQ